MGVSVALRMTCPPSNVLFSKMLTTRARKRAACGFRLHFRKGEQDVQEDRDSPVTFQRGAAVRLRVPADLPGPGQSKPGLSGPEPAAPGGNQCGPSPDPAVAEQPEGHHGE